MVQAPEEHEVHVWWLDLGGLSSASVERCAVTFLSAEEQLRAGRFLQATDRNQYVIGRTVLKQALAACLGVPPNEISLRSDARGRPYLASELTREIDFNVSHTRGAVAVAVGFGVTLGVDVERVRADFPTLDVARHAFSAETSSELANMGAAARNTRFIEYWVLLEAYAKALGLGLSLPFHSHSVAIAGQPPRISLSTVGGAQMPAWRFDLFAPKRDLRLAIAARGASAPIIHRLSGAGAAAAFCPIATSVWPS